MITPDSVSAKPSAKIEAESQRTPSIISEPKSYLSRFNFLERGFKYFGAGVAASVLSSKIMIPFMTSGMDWCPEFPKPFYSYVRNACLAREYLPGLTGAYNNCAFKAPIVEELMFRVGLQEILLKKTPKAILNQFAPSYVGIVDTKIAKVARVTLTAIAFSLAHAMPPESGWPNCSTARLVNTFVLGLLLGGVQEVTESPLMAMFLHSGLNIQPAFLLEQLGMTMQCPPA